MKKYVALFLFPITCWAQRPVVLAPGSSPEKFRQHIISQSSLVSVADYLSSHVETHDDKVFALADNIEDSPEQILAQVARVRAESVFSDNGSLFLKDLLSKLQSRSLSKEFQKSYQELQCFNDSLLKNPLAKFCLVQKIDTKVLQKNFPWADSILIESRSYKLSQTHKIELSAISPYHFQILSNTHKTVSFHGTLGQLLQQSFRPDTWVAGSCDQFNATIENFSLREQGLVFFSSDCMQELRAPRSNFSLQKWTKENRTWIYTAGVLVLGGLIYSMKDKTVVVDTSGFK